MRLSELTNGQQAVICKVIGRDAFRHRITEMGFVKGKVIEVVKNAPLKDPIEYSIMGYSVSLRRNEASLIEVSTELELLQALPFDTPPITLIDNESKVIPKAGKVINVAFVGNPNTGKTSLFNCLSGTHEHVGNYSGVTVELKKAEVKMDGYILRLVDLPGTYSLTAYSPEERYVRQYIATEMPDVIVNVLDATNLERNLYLTTQLIDMDMRTIIALNMFDELQQHNDSLNHQQLERMLAMPIVPTVGSRGKGLPELIQTIIHSFTGQTPVQVQMRHHHIHINYGRDLEQHITTIQNLIRTPENAALTDLYSSRFLSIKLLEEDEIAKTLVYQECANNQEILGYSKKAIIEIEEEFRENSETVISDARYGFIAGALRETFTSGKKERHRITKSIDRILTNKYLGFPIFLFFMWFMFVATFTLGNYPVEWINGGIENLSALLNELIPDSILKDLLLDGVISGVGAVIAFLPNILILFFFISLLEDTGYMARAVFITDKLMHGIGLHGKSFIPLVMGFGCNVPAIMATRTIENRAQRMLTMLLVPFMSCSARLPVYILLIGAFFPAYAGSMLFGIYMIGLAFAIFTGLICSKFIFKEKGQPFVMELPPYRLPTLKSALHHMWHKGSQYLQKMSGVILIGAVIIWALSTFPRSSESMRLAEENATEDYTKLMAEADSSQYDDLTLNFERAKHSLRQEHSYLGQLGKIVEPAMQPLGFDWKMSVSLLTGVIAKETVISTLSVVYGAPSSNEENTPALIENLKKEYYTHGEKVGQAVFTTASTLSFLIFILLYIPCLATIAVMQRESGNMRFTVLSVLYTIFVAWGASFIIYHIALYFN
ncbi:MAG: ferrous iron transport protein B [Bacteroidales bacterium]